MVELKWRFKWSYNNDFYLLGNNNWLFGMYIGYILHGQRESITWCFYMVK